jgi:arsenite-transporting ATPase
VTAAAPRLLLLTGKGGVGKTTTSAATALACADRGLRTLVLSTDPAHSLADAFDVRLGSEPTVVAPLLDGQQLDTRVRLEESWGDIGAYLSSVLDWAGVDAIEAEELTVLPGLDELLALTDLVGHAAGGRYDIVVVDCAPTAETLRLLSLPEVLGWWMDRLFPLSQRITKAIGPAVRQMTGGVPIAGDDVFSAVRRLYDRLAAVRALLADADQTSVRLVVNPERVVIAEARRTATYLALFGYGVDAVVVNRLLPAEVTDPWFARWHDAHAEHLADIEAGFAPLPVLRSYLAADEPVGVERLRAFAAALYGELDPSARLHQGDVMRVTRLDGGASTLTLELPFSDRKDLRLVRRNDELVVTIGPYRRALLLPDALRARAVTDAELDGGRLVVTFGAR